jgi:hypothetical protein
LKRLLQGFYQALTQLSQGVYKAFKGLFTRFPHVCLQCCLQGFDNALYKAFTMFCKDLTRCFQCFYKDCTRLLLFVYKVLTRLVQGLHKVFTMCVTRFLQGVYKVAYKAFTMCSTWLFQRFPHGLYNVCLRGFHNVFFARVLHDCHNAFIRLYKALTRCLQRFHNVFCSAFTRLSESVCNVFFTRRSEGF